MKLYQCTFIFYYIKIYWSILCIKWIFYIIQYQKNTSININTHQKSHYLLESISNRKTRQAHGNEYKFSKILTFAWKLKFYNWQQVLSVVFLKVTVLFHSFLKKRSAVYPGLDNFICVSALSSQYDVSWAEAVSWVCNSKPSHECFSLRLWYAAEVLYVYFSFHHIKNIRKLCTQGPRLIKINSFYCFIKDILK